jgi:hypothetical protein
MGAIFSANPRVESSLEITAGGRIRDERCIQIINEYDIYILGVQPGVGELGGGGDDESAPGGPIRWPS